ncbi:MAG TPA: CoA-acylating methylmalonate-semialdehyde dehydrogenase [Gaiellaceae bacterium]
MTELATPPVEQEQELKRISHWIGGRSVAGESGRSGPVYNPALGRQTGTVDFATPEEVDRAVQAAKEAFASWRTISLSKRTAIFFRIRDLVDEHREDIARFLTAEHGKVLSDALGEVARGLEVIEYCCGIPELLKGEFSEQASTGIDVYSIRQPLGVVAGITPFNFPAMVPMWMWAPAIACGNCFVLKPSEKDPSTSMYVAELLKGGFSEQASTGIDVYSIRQPLGVCGGITPFNFPAMVPMWMWAPALACGNTFVLKPSEKDPSASIYVADLLKEAGVPDGVFNVVHGDKVAVDALLEHPDVAAVSFVGSTPIAKYVYETGTRAGKRIQALGGAKNHMIVLPDADIDMAADAAVSAAYGSAGERCMAISQVVAVGHAADELVDAIKARIPKVKVGNGLEPDVEMGPLVTREHRDRVASYVEKAPAEGARVVVDGREGAPEDGFFLAPSLLDDVKPGMKAYDDEIFGPVLGVARVDTYDEAVQLVNENPYGNGTAIFTRDGGVARQFQFEVQAGMVGINVPIPVPVAYYSFGGWKSSLFGDTHIYGPEGINFYTRGKVVTSRWPDPATSKVDLGFPQTR